MNWLQANALLVDMSIPYSEYPVYEDSHFSSMRDSMYILMNMNQYTMKHLGGKQKEAEGLLRIVLFSKDLKLIETSSTLREVRQELAKSLRHGRRKGVVPVFISTMWFLFSLAISIQGGKPFAMMNIDAKTYADSSSLRIDWPKCYSPRSSTWLVALMATCTDPQLHRRS